MKATTIINTSSNILNILKTGERCSILREESMSMGSKVICTTLLKGRDGILEVGRMLGLEDELRQLATLIPNGLQMRYIGQAKNLLNLLYKDESNVFDLCSFVAGVIIAVPSHFIEVSFVNSVDSVGSMFKKCKTSCSKEEVRDLLKSTEIESLIQVLGPELIAGPAVDLGIAAIAKSFESPEASGSLTKSIELISNFMGGVNGGTLAAVAGVGGLIAAAVAIPSLPLILPIPTSIMLLSAGEAALQAVFVGGVLTVLNDLLAQIEGDAKEMLNSLEKGLESCDRGEVVFEDGLTLTGCGLDFQPDQLA